MKTLPAMLERRNQLVSEAKALNEAAANESRNFSKSEKLKYDSCMAEVRDLNEQIQRAQELQALEHGLSQSMGTRAAQYEAPGGGSSGAPFPDGTLVLRPEQRFADFVSRPEKPFSWDKFIRGWAYGKWDSDSEYERRLMSVGADVLGGYTAPEFLQAEILDEARNNMVLVQAGARTATMQAPVQYIARVSGSPTGAWTPENQEITGEDFNFDRLTVTARKYASRIIMSIELSEDMVDGGGTIKRALSEIAQIGLDYAGLMGSGVGEEPLGLYNWPGVNEVAAGTVVTFDYFSQAIQKVWEANGSPGAYLLAPRDAGILDRAKDGEGLYLPLPEFMKGLKRGVSKQIPATLGAGTDSVAFVGDFSQMVLCIRSPLRLELAREAGDSFAKAQIQLRLIMRADVVILREKFFTKITGLKAS